VTAQQPDSGAAGGPAPLRQRTLVVDNQAALVRLVVPLG
jgi:hypothetical protein